MTTLDTAYWKQLDSLLQRGLAVPREGRAAWLTGLPPEHQPFRAMLAAMLERSGADGDGSESGAFMGRPVEAGTIDAATEKLVADQPGDRVGPYRLVAELGTGGMGTVWRAEREDGGVARPVALKLPRSGWSPGLAERLKRECDILATLEHPGIARLYDAGVLDSGRPWLAMEIIEGEPIDAYCRSRKLSVAGRLALFLEVAAAISYAHARLVVHRDLKPSNILVDTQGHVHVVDFGLAKLLDTTAAGQPELTQALGRTLTPDYASPEQIRGDAMTVGTDVYSLGVVLYELLAGRRPYRLRRETPAALEEAILEADVPVASAQAADRAVARELRGDLDTILAKALRKDVAQRYSTVEAFAADVERFIRRQPVLARPPSITYHASRFVRRHRAGVGAAVVVMIAIVAGLAGTLYQAREAAAERDRAVRELRFAEAAEEFMRFLLSVQSTRPLPAPELLRRAERSASQQFADDASLRARMQLLLADLYGELGDYKRAEAVVVEARRSAQAAGDRWLQVQSDCVLAAVHGATGRNNEAVALFATAMPAVEADPRADPVTTQVCYSQRSITLRNLGKADESARDAERALASIGESHPGYRVNRIFLKTNIADALTNAGRVNETVALYEEAVSELGKIGRGRTSAGLLLANNLIVMLTRAGQYRRAVAAYERIGAAEEGDPPAFTSLSINYGRVLFEIGRAEEAARMLEDGRKEAIRQGDARGEAFAMLTAAGMACAGTDAGRCEKLRGAAEARLRPVLPPKHSTFATLQYLAGRAAMIRGEPAQARALLENAVTVFEAAPDRNLLVTRALSELAIAQQRSGDPQAASASAKKAVDIARRAATGFEHTNWLGGALLAQAVVLAEQGDPAAARTILAEARRQLAGSSGDAAPALQQAAALAATLK